MLRSIVHVRHVILLETHSHRLLWQHKCLVARLWVDSRLLSVLWCVPLQKIQEEDYVHNMV
jgi:hypothetical protein